MDSSPSAPKAGNPSVRLEPERVYLRLQSVTIFVRDLDRSVPFYVDQLGFNLLFDGRSQTARPWVAVAPPDGIATLVLRQPEPDSQEFKLIGRATQVAFVTEDVIAKFREWRRHGVERAVARRYAQRSSAALVVLAETVDRRFIPKNNRRGGPTAPTSALPAVKRIHRNFACPLIHRPAYMRLMVQTPTPWWRVGSCAPLEFAGSAPIRGMRLAIGRSILEV